MLRPKSSNIDLAVIVASIKEPELDLIQLNRYLAYLKYYNKRNHNHLLSQSTYNNKNIDLPQIGNKIKYENGGGSYRRTLQSFDSNLDSSLHYSTKKSKKAFSDYIRYASFKAKKDNYNAQKKLNDILYETKK